jgi:uncharacterized protein YdcH (DUF465 family)
MTEAQLFGDETSPLRGNPVFRKYMEEYKVLRVQIGRMQERRGYLSYEEVQELTKLKKIRLSCKDGMEKCKRTL